MAKFFKVQIILFIAAIMPPPSFSLFCPLNFNAVGAPFRLQDFTSCSPITSTFSYTMEICRDLCMRSQPDCKSFSYGCGEQPSRINCRLFNLSISDLLERTLSGECLIQSAQNNCVHEDYVRITIEKQDCFLE